MRRAYRAVREGWTLFRECSRPGRTLSGSRLYFAEFHWAKHFEQPVFHAGGVRRTYEADDNHQIYMVWKRLRHRPTEVMDRLYRSEIVDPGAYYFRTTPYLETSSEKYSWMNRICSIASGSL